MTTPEVKKGRSSAARTVLAGLLPLGFAWWLHLQFSKLESGEMESMQTHWLVASLYRNLGHAGTVALFAGMGGLVLVLAVVQFVRSR